jgi:integrase
LRRLNSTALVFTGQQGGVLRRGDFRKAPRWSDGVAAIDLPGLHFHDLRHTGNTLAAQAGVSLADLKARMGHHSVRAAMICQHTAAEADQKIADTLDQRMRKARDDARNQS